MEKSLDWESNENIIIWNPKLSQSAQTALTRRAQQMISDANLQGHVLISSSGSTAVSVEETKIVALSKHAFLNSARRVIRYFRISHVDSFLQSLPDFHVGGLSISARAHLTGGKLINIPWGEWNVHEFYRSLLEHKASVISLVPTQIYDIVQAKLEAPEFLRLVFIGGAAFSESLRDQALDLGWECRVTYGMTETASMIAEIRNGILQPFETVHLKSSRQNLLQVRCASLLTCYGVVNEKKQNEIQKPVGPDGWYLTEDMVSFRRFGYFLMGRSKEFVKIGGEGVYLPVLSQRLESIIVQKFPNLYNKVAIVAMNDDRLGSEIHLVSQEEQVADLISEFNQQVLPFERIRNQHHVNKIPRSDLGKILWGELQSQIVRNQ